MNSEEGPKGDPVFALPGNASYSWSLPQREVGTNTVLTDCVTLRRPLYQERVTALWAVTPGQHRGLGSGTWRPPHLFTVQPKKPGPQVTRDLAKGHVLPRTILAHAC